MWAEQRENILTGASGQLSRLILSEDGHTGVGTSPMRQHHCASNLLVPAAGVYSEVDCYFHALIELGFGLVLHPIAAQPHMMAPHDTAVMCERERLWRCWLHQCRCPAT